MNPLPEASIPARWRRVVSEHSHRAAVRADAVEWTYAELDAHSTTVAGQVLACAGAVQKPVALLLEHGALMIASVLGVLKTGGLYVGLDASHPEPVLKSLLADSGARLLLADTTTESRARAVAPNSVHIQILNPRAANQTSPPRLPEVDADAGAWLTYTSGSTGAPKGVWRNHATVLHHADIYARLIQAQPDDRFTLLTPLGLAASATPMFTALLHGACLCPFDVRSRGEERLGQWLNQEALTVCHLVPTLFRRLLRTWPTGRGPLRVVRLGGEAVLRTDVEAHRRSAPSDCVLMHALSSTETGLIAALLLDVQTPMPEGRLPVGAVVEGVEVTLLDERGEPVPPGNEGRLVVKSRALAKGYWRQPEETQARFRSDPTTPDRQQFFSADLARFRPDGHLEHLGRLDQQVKVRGHRVDLTEIESALNHMQGVREAAVTLDITTEGGASPVAWIVTEPGATVTSRSCRHFLADRLPGPMIPRRVVLRTALPIAASGKLDRQSLQRQLAAPPTAERPRSQPMPRDDIEKHIARIWESVLGLEGIGRRENLFDLGADSLHTLEIMTRVNDALAVEVPAAALMTHSTVESLAAEAANQTIRHDPSPLIALRTASPGQPLFLVPGGHGHVSAFGQLARQLPDRPVYAFQAPGLEAECWPLMSIPAIASRYIQEVLALHPVEPVHLGGLCVGGTIVFEMARQLVTQGCPVGLVALIETHHPDHKGRAAPLASRLQNAVRDGFRILRWRLIRAVGLGRGPEWLPVYRRFIANMYGRARRRYRPGYYAGPLTLVLAGDTHPREIDDPRLWMGRHAAGVRKIALPHPLSGLFAQPCVEDLATALQSWMNSAAPAKRSL